MGRSQSDGKPPVAPRSNNENAVNKTLTEIRRKYTLMSAQNVRPWQTYLAIGLAAGIVTGVFLVANRSGEVERGKAAELPVIDNVTVAPGPIARGEPVTIALIGKGFGATPGVVEIATTPGGILGRYTASIPNRLELAWWDTIIFLRLYPSETSKLLPGQYDISFRLITKEGTGSVLASQRAFTIVARRLRGVPFHMLWTSLPGWPYERPAQHDIVWDWSPSVNGPGPEDDGYVWCDGVERLAAFAQPTYQGWIMNNQFGPGKDRFYGAVFTGTITRERAGETTIVDQVSIFHPKDGFSPQDVALQNPFHVLGVPVKIQPGDTLRLFGKCTPFGPPGMTAMITAYYGVSVEDPGMDR